MRGHLCGPYLALLGLAFLVAPLHAISSDEVEAQEFMKELNGRYSIECNKEMVARWDYITDVTDKDKEEAANAAAVYYLNFKGEAAVNCSEYEYENFEDVELYRKFRFLSKKGPGGLDPDELAEYKKHQANMETTYSTATICDFYNQDECGLQLEPDIEAIMASSTNWDELTYVWEQWREKTGMLMRDDFMTYVELSNKAATLDGFDNTGEYWLSGYTVDQREANVYTNGKTVNPQEFKDMLSTVWEEVSEGLYKKLHAYVRMKMQTVYPGKIDPEGPLPSHILGDMWAQTWGNVGKYVMPFPDMPSYDVTDSMVENGWDILEMFQKAEDFFRSIGLFNMTDIFWEKSVINQTEWGKVMICPASAEDFCLGSEGNDYRIKMCTEVNMEDLVTVHHEMGHIEYFMAYKNQPFVFRDSANPGIHEAIGDLIALSVSTPKHLEDVLGLTPKSSKVQKHSRYTDDEKRDLNFLMQMALEKIAFLPFGYLIDKYRWGVFDGSITKEELNAGWWNLRESLQGVIPPEGERGEEFFDPGAKYHVPANVPYIRYFVSFVVQFQFYENLCKAAGHTGSLHTCDIYNNADAGAILKSALEKGFSEPWPSVLKDLAGSDNINSQSIITYFDPLIQYLDQVLEENNQCIGWGDDCEEDDINEAKESITSSPETTTSSPETTTTPVTTTIVPVDPTKNETLAREEMDAMDLELTFLYQTATELDWEYYINDTDANGKIANAAWGNVSHVFREWYNKTIGFYDYENFEDETLVRRFRLQKNLGTSALSDDDFNKLNELVTRMTDTYNKAEVEDFHDDETLYSIDELSTKFAQVTQQAAQVAQDKDVEKVEKELRHYWTEWRDKSGKNMGDDYKDYVDLQNKAAENEMNGFADAVEMWLEPYAEPDLQYSTDDFKNDIADLWESLKDLYQDLHAYVRFKLQKKYGHDVIDSDFIPAHLLGDLWAQNWENVYDLVAPYENVNIPDISDALKDNIGNVTEMKKIAENFFVSLGLYNMTDDFNKHSVFSQNSEGTVICHASAWDFYDIIVDDDPSIGRFRIKMCADKNQEDFIVIHHEMGHIEYYMSYSHPIKERPLVFRSGANPGFHEAIGDTIALSVMTPKHLELIENYLNNGGTEEPETTTEFSMTETSISSTSSTKLPTDPELEKKQNINFLMKIALEKIAFLPYAYILDQWRWELFAANETTNKEYNKKWWNLRLNIQGISPPEKRYPSSDFDPGSKFHIANDVPYIRYFVAHILQFQFHHRLCAIAKGDKFEEDEVFNCDIYNSTKAGAALRKLLHKGSSVEWHTQLQDFMGTGDGNMNASAILAYFSPLQEFLDEFLKSWNQTAGWELDKVDDYMKDEVAYVPATVPIIVGVVLAVMVLAVMVAYIVGRSKQKKKAQKAAEEEKGEDIEISVQQPTTVETTDHTKEMSHYEITEDSAPSTSGKTSEEKF